MGFLHGKNTVVKLGANDISDYTSSTEIKQKADTHDTTPYNSGSHTYAGGLLDATITISGTYDTTVTTGPGDAIRALLGTEVDFTYQEQGTGTGKPQRLVSVIVSGFDQTAPSDDMVSWSADLQCTGDIDDTAQS